METKKRSTSLFQLLVSLFTSEKVSTELKVNPKEGPKMTSFEYLLPIVDLLRSEDTDIRMDARKRILSISDQGLEPMTIINFPPSFRDDYEIFMQELIKKVPVEKLDFDGLLTPTKNTWCEKLSRRTALMSRIPASKLDFDHLLEILYLEEDEWYKKEVASRLLFNHFRKKLTVKDFGMIIARVHDKAFEKKVKKFALSIPVEQLNYAELIEFSKLYLFDIHNLAAELLLLHFPGLLSFDFLIEAQERGILVPNDMAMEVLLNRYSKKLNYEILLDFQRSGNPDTRKRARDLIIKISPKSMDLSTLLLNTYNAEDGVISLAKELIGLIPAEDYDLECLIDLQSHHYSDIRESAEKLALLIPKEKLNKDILNTCLKSEDKRVQSLAHELLMKLR